MSALCFLKEQVISIHINMISFYEYLKLNRQNEGLWLNDKNAVLGRSKIAPPPEAVPSGTATAKNHSN